MATSPKNYNRLLDGGIKFLPGVNSGLHPTFLDMGAWSWAINTSSRGGITVTRPGFTSTLRLPDGRAQGLILFEPTGGVPSLVAAVNGRIWVSPFPFTSASILPNIIFSATVDQIVFKQALKTATNGIPSDPAALLMMQDGTSRAAYWDGTIGRHLNPGASETPTGLSMEWIGSRLWVARGNQIFASDIADPTLFTENTYLATGGSLQPLDGLKVMALAKTADNKALLVGTLENTTIIRAGITDRSQWKTTPDFISLLFPGVGFTGPKCFTYSDGELWWFSKEGGRRFTQVGATIQVSKNNVASNEMLRSFQNLSPLLSRVCATQFDGFVGFSVPSGDIYNRHTWVIDTAVESFLSGDYPVAWQGIWMGTRPVEWTTATVNGEDRCFFLSQDRDGAVRIWEAFDPTQQDDGTDIFCSLEGPGLMFKEPWGFKRFRYTEQHHVGLRGTSHITTEYKGDYGCWKKILDILLCATPCRPLDCTDQNMAASPQARYVKTQESRHVCETKEGPFSDDIGTFFQNRFRWYGINGIYKYRSQADQWQEDSVGACQKGDVSADGLVQCVPKFCCDEEVDYISRARDHSYVYGSGNNEVISSV